MQYFKLLHLACLAVYFIKRFWENSKCCAYIQKGRFRNELYQIYMNLLRNQFPPNILNFKYMYNNPVFKISFFFLIGVL